MSSRVFVGLRVTRGEAGEAGVEAARSGDVAARLDEMLAADGVSEGFALQTCLRVELYAVADTLAAGRAALSGTAVADEAAVWMTHEECLRHLFRVAAGVESVVVGEDQILGQVREAVETADAAGALGPVLEPALSKTVRVGKRARSETAVNDGPTSIAGAAVSLVERKRGLGDATVLVVGAGEMGTHVARAVAVRGVATLRLANRTRETAARLVDRLDAEATAVGLDTVPDVLADVDAVVSATASPEPVLEPAAFADAGRTFVVDVAQPRDVDPEAADCEGVELRDLDTLESMTETTDERRQAAIERVEAMVEEAISGLLEQYKRQRVEDVVAGMYRGADRIKQRELETAFSKLEHHGELTDEQREDVEALADALVSELLGLPADALRDAAADDDWRTIATAIELFEPEFDADAHLTPDAAPTLALLEYEPAKLADEGDDD